jgi:hypothetical protein
MKFEANILSVNDRFTEERFAQLERALPDAAVVEVFHTGLGRVVGSASHYRRQGPNLWAQLDVEDGVPSLKRCAAVIVLERDVPRVVAVFWTSLSKDGLARLAAEVAK